MASLNWGARPSERRAHLSVARAMFETESSVCTYGPCEGAVLDELEVEVIDGDVCLTDTDYEFVKLGPSSTTDRSTQGGLGF